MCHNLICLFLDWGDLDADERRIIQEFRSAKEKLAQRSQPRISFNRDGTQRKCYTSKRRRLSANFNGLKKLRRSMEKAVRVLPLLAICCLVGVSDLSVDVDVAQSHFSQLTVAEQWSFVTGGLREGYGYFRSFDSTHTMCHECWWSFHGFSRSYYFKAQKAVRAFPGMLPPMGTGRRRPKGHTPEWHGAFQWMSAFVEDFGDPMPDDNTIQLPVCTQSELYDCYTADTVEDECIHASTFARLVRKEFPHVRVHEYKKFKKCDYCKKCDTIVNNHANSKQRRTTYAEKKRIHRERVRAEKQKYYHHRHKAREFPERYLSIIIDNMDQAKLKTPGFARDSHTSESLYRLKMHCTGVIVHGKPNKTFAYLWPDRFPKDPNMTCSILMDVLDKIETTADILYLQLDGCSGENKNRDVMATCAYLVAIGAFSKVKVSFLPVGHTHEDIDQMFSTFAGPLRRSDFVTVAALGDLIASSLSPAPVVSLQLPRIFDFKGFFHDHMFKAWDQISRYRCFKFQMHPDGYPVCFTRQNMAGAKQLNFAIGRHKSASKQQTVRMSTAERVTYVRECTVWEPQYGQRVLRSLPEKETPCAAVPSKPLPYKYIEQTVQTMHDSGMCSTADVRHWEAYLDRFKEEDEEECLLCGHYRTQIEQQRSNKSDTKVVVNAKARKYYHFNNKLLAHLREADHDTFCIVWPASFVDRRRPPRHLVAAEDVEMKGCDSEDEAAKDGLAGNKLQKPFSIGNKAERFQRAPARVEHESRIGTFVAIWCNATEDPERGYAAVGRIQKFGEEVDEETGVPSQQVIVQWMGNYGQKCGHQSEWTKPFHPGWGVENTAVYMKIAPRGKLAFIGTEYFDSVLCWTVRLVNNKIKDVDLERINEALEATKERLRVNRE